MKKKEKNKSIKRKAGEINCRDCLAPCCRDLAMLITKPRNKTEINELKWYLHFNTVDIFIRNHKWYLFIKGKCIFLTKENKCKIYSKRPVRCRKHTPPGCERFGNWYDVLITTPDGIDDFLKKSNI